MLEGQIVAPTTCQSCHRYSSQLSGGVSIKIESGVHSTNRRRSWRGRRIAPVARSHPGVVDPRRPANQSAPQGSLWTDSHLHDVSQYCEGQSV